MYVSQLLSEYIKTKKINIKKCAEYFQIDRSTLYKIIRGERTAPSRDFILKMSQYLYLTNDEKKEFLNCKMKLELRNWDKGACPFIPIHAAAGPLFSIFV